MPCPPVPCDPLVSRFDKDQFIYKESNATDALRYDIQYGVEPLRFSILDRSIARTWPISSWHISISTNNFRLGWPDNQISYQRNTDSILRVNQDQQNMFDLLSSHVFRYGDYKITMNVQASTTSTSSDKVFVQYVKVAEFEPWAYFWATHAYTVPSNYSNSNIPITSLLNPIVPVPNANLYDDDICFEFISGYAPNLTIYFVESSEPHTFPISSYHWNFGDPYNEGPQNIFDINSNYYTVTAGNTSGDFNTIPVCWTTDVIAHTARHVYTMPGTYDVTLTVRASNTGTSDTYARYTPVFNNIKRFYVHVVEIPPQCNNAIRVSNNPNTGFSNSPGHLNGILPVTGYFMASGIIAGSFPICRIDWDFGDGTIEKITRLPSMTSTSQGLPISKKTFYSYDLEDPRNFVIPHVYENNILNPVSYNVYLSAYACNTNNLTQCSAMNLVSVEPYIPPPREEDKKLIGSRFDEDGNLIYVLEGDSVRSTYTVVLTGELT